ATPDTVPPDPVEDLATAEATSNSLRLTWTATGDDGAIGTADHYDVRYSTTPIDAGNFQAAQQATGEPNPSPSGSAESTEVTGLQPGTLYHFALVVRDEWGTASGLSNTAGGTTLPPPTGSVSPDAVSATVRSGDLGSRVVTLSNVGLGTLDFTIPTPLLEVPEPAFAASNAPAAPGDRAIEYRWTDSHQPGGPVFDWIDISATGTLLEEIFSDEDRASVRLGFEFPFYGQHFDEVVVHSNGYLSFTSRIGFYYLNTVLPSTEAPENLVAPWWDDLDFEGRRGAFFQDFGDRVVIQWSDVGKYNYPLTHLTFQVILKQNGEITFQYLTFQGVVDGFDRLGTIGIQNATRDAGLQVVYNKAYVHDGLAVRITPLPQWLSVTPTSGRLAAGASIPLTLGFDPFGMDAGAYRGTVAIATNDPGHPTLEVEAAMDVIGAPQVESSPQSLAFGDVILGSPGTRILRVRNAGSALLHVTSIAADRPDLKLPGGPFDLPPRGIRDLAVDWEPTDYGDLSAVITIASDDADTPILAVPLSGRAVPPPELSTAPAGFAESLHSGQKVTRSLTLGNAGGVDLIVAAAADQGSDGHGLVGASEPGLLGAGGPDSFGYRWRDSDAPGGPSFDWVEIGATGSPVTFPSADDSVAGPIEMQMSFPFYGVSVSRVWISTNGWIAFTAPASSDLANDPLPSTAAPRNLIGVFWDDLHRRTGSARYRFDGTRFIVQFSNFGRVTPSSGVSLTFEVILYPNGRIVSQYLTMTGAPLDSATIGMQNDARNMGLSVVHNANYLHDGLAIEINRTPDWLTVTPLHFVIPPGGSVPLEVTFDATAREGGLLTGGLVLTTNSAVTPEVRLPASLEVVGSPVAAIFPAAHDFGTVFAGSVGLGNLTVINNGSAVLQIGDIVSTDPDLFVEPGIAGGPVPAAGTPLAPGEALLLNLRWQPTVPSTLDAAVLVASDDPVNPLRVVPMSGIALATPVAAASPTAVGEALKTGEVAHRTIRLANSGGSDLEYSAIVRVATGAQVAVHEAFEPKEGEPDPRVGILGAGGPDGFGYTWQDSDAPGGPAYDWVDIRDVGTRVRFTTAAICDDCLSAPLPIGFAFPFYGQRFETLRATTNGALSFTSTLTNDANQPLPAIGAGVPENLLAPFWDDLVERDGSGAEPRASTLHYLNDGSRFIVQYTHYYRIGAVVDDLEFQVILTPDGRIVYQYRTLASLLTSATVGIQNATKSDGITVVFNAGYLHAGLAIELRPPRTFLRVQPDVGSVPPGGVVDLDVTLDATDLNEGGYAGRVDLVTNDPVRGVLGIPVTLNVGFVAPVFAGIEPRVLNLNSQGPHVTVTVELPSDLDPHAVDPCGVTLAGVVRPIGCPGPPAHGAVRFADGWPAGGDGVQELVLRFDRQALAAALASSGPGPVLVVGEVTDVQWWRGTVPLRVSPARPSPAGRWRHDPSNPPVERAP
ncbi:MAG TPA: choice-of-anchor D domain-containing protein, partial [Dongiaceae bacterium]|nr:choice-of-anchor D domain-containing protein [Dongiaceae bacterium]